MEELIAQQTKEAASLMSQREAAAAARADALTAVDRQYQSAMDEIHAAEAALAAKFNDAIVARAAADIEVLPPVKLNNGKGDGK